MFEDNDVNIFILPLGVVDTFRWESLMFDDEHCMYWCFSLKWDPFCTTDQLFLWMKMSPDDIQTTWLFKIPQKCSGFTVNFRSVTWKLFLTFKWKFLGDRNVTWMCFEVREAWLTPDTGLRQTSMTRGRGHLRGRMVFPEVFAPCASSAPSGTLAVNEAGPCYGIKPGLVKSSTI